MSEERTQPASKRRRQLAREQGQVAHSPELTAAVGWLVAIVVFGMVGENLTRGLTEPSARIADPIRDIGGRARRGRVARAGTCHRIGVAAGGDPGRLRDGWRSPHTNCRFAVYGQQP